MFETRCVIRPTALRARVGRSCKPSTSECWQGLRKHFDFGPSHDALNETHDPGAAQLRRVGQRRPAPISRSRTCRSGCSGARDAHEAFRGGVAIGDQIVDLRRSRGGPLSRRRARAAALLRHADAERIHGARSGRVVGAAHGAVARAARGSAEREPLARLPGRASRGRTRAACAHRRLHRLLHRRSTTRRRVGRLFRPDNPLLPNYKWVPIGYHGRASSIVRVSGTRVPAAARPDAGRRRERAGRSARRSGSTTSSSSASSSAPGNALGEPIPIARGRGARVRPRACSTTGRRATSRRGSTSRWARSSRRTSPPRCRRGS